MRGSFTVAEARMFTTLFLGCLYFFSATFLSFTKPVSKTNCYNTVKLSVTDHLYHHHHRVAVTGIYRATPLRVTRRQRAVKAVYRTYVDVIHFRKTDTRRLRGREEEEEEENG